jgi:hypothetical protein
MLAAYVALMALAGFLSRRALFEWLQGLTRPRLRLPNSVADWASIIVPLLAVAAIMRLYVDNASRGLKMNIAGWRYMADATLLLKEGGIPETSVQWGIERPWALSKLGGSLWLGSLRLLSGLSEFDALQYIPILFLSIAILGSWVLLRLILGRIAASGGLLLLFANFALLPLPFNKFTRLTIEGMALSLAPLMLWALLKGDRDRIPQLRWLAFALLIVIGITHGVVFLMSLTALGAYLGVRLLSRKASLLSLARDSALYVLIPVLVVLSGLLVGSQVEILSGVRSESDYQLVDGVGDPTGALSAVLAGRSIHDAAPPSEGLKPPPRRLFEIMAQYTVSEEYSELGRFVVENNDLAFAVVAIVALAGFALVPSLRWAIAAALIFIIGIYVIAFLFTVRYDLWIYTVHSLRREYKYISLGVLAIGLLLAAGLLRAPWLRNAAIRTLIGSVLAIAPIGLFITTEITDAPWRHAHFRPNLAQTFEWLRDDTPEDSVILSNIRSAGVFELYAERVSLTEGQVAYLFPDLLDHSLALLDASQVWFSEPDFEFLREQGVDYVVAFRTRGSELPGNPYAKVKDPRSFEELSFLRIEADFGGAVVYKVVSPGPPTRGSLPSRVTEDLLPEARSPP